MAPEQPLFDPRDQRGEQEWFELVSTDVGVFGCIGMMACDEVCPKDLPLLEIFSYIGRKMDSGLQVAVKDIELS